MRFKPLKSVDYIVVHCSNTPANKDIGVEEIDKKHREQGWRHIGHHVVIRRDGTVEFGRPLDTPGATCGGTTTSPRASVS